MAIVIDKNDGLYIELADNELYTIKDRVIIITKQTKKSSKKKISKKIKLSQKD